MTNIHSLEKIHIKALAITAVCVSALALFIWLMVSSYLRVNTDNLESQISIKDQQLVIFQNRVDNLREIIVNYETMSNNNDTIIGEMTKIIVIMDLKLNQTQSKLNQCIDREDEANG